MNEYDRKRLDAMAVDIAATREDSAVTRTKVESIERDMQEGKENFTAIDKRISNLEAWRNRLVGAIALLTAFWLWAAKWLPWIKSGGGG